MRDEIEPLAAAEHFALDDLARRLARAERQRRLGTEMAAHDPTDTEQAVIAVGLATVQQHAVR